MRESLAKLCAPLPLSAEEAAATAFHLAANLHAEFWMDDRLRDFEWLCGADAWRSEAATASFTAALAHAAASWTAAMQKRALGQSKVPWHPLVVDCVTASIAKADWATHRLRLQASTRAATLS